MYGCSIYFGDQLPQLVEVGLSYLFLFVLFCVIFGHERWFDPILLLGKLGMQSVQISLHVSYLLSCCVLLEYYFLRLQIKCRLQSIIFPKLRQQIQVHFLSKIVLQSIHYTLPIILKLHDLLHRRQVLLPRRHPLLNDCYTWPIVRRFLLHRHPYLRNPLIKLRQLILQLIAQLLPQLILLNLCLL